jgi:hypothetical protein
MSAARLKHFGWCREREGASFALPLNLAHPLSTVISPHAGKHGRNGK